MHGLPSTNFAFLESHDEQLVSLGMLAEKYFADDPNTCLLKLRQFSEFLTQVVASQVGLYQAELSQYDQLRLLYDQGVLPSEVKRLFDEVRRTGNQAVHEFSGDHGRALNNLKLSWQLGLWFHRTFKEPNYKSGAFIPPSSPKNESDALREELERLSNELKSSKTEFEEKTDLLGQLQENFSKAKDEQAFWEEMALQTEKANAELLAKLAAQQQLSATLTTQERSLFAAKASQAATNLQLDEKETRQLIDQQLRDVGWQVDSEVLRHGKGARPEKGSFKAIAEWPTSSGPADYVLFIGLMPVAVVEAKRKNIDVSAALVQAKRYSRDFVIKTDFEDPGGAWGEYKIPFCFSANGRPYLKQLETKSGIWFWDARQSTNLSRALDGWYTPEGLKALLKIDANQASEELEETGFEYELKLRDYQQKAIRATEKGIKEGQQAMLLAMATGTGKTKTCIALIYRLLKAQRFRRILFLVDRSALGEQATNAFKDTRLENLQTFSDTFGIKELDDKTPDTATAVQIATVQGMVQRILMPSENNVAPPVDQYDCIVIDECHRGYLLDRELSDTELSFRSYDDYISKYRRVIEYFDAVKIGLTATPALHTTQIFGAPVFQYSYREAVIDGWLIDHEPPIQITTDLAKNGMMWAKGEAIKLYNPKTGEISQHNTPDEIKLEIESFNKKVITQSFNAAVCDYLAEEIDPESKRKTLIFCVTDAHADMVVNQLKKAFKEAYGSVDDDAVVKITGNADKPLNLIRRYKNEPLPSVVVTVDLLTTGIDVPEICNLVFLRRVNSRILYEQMMGRATRLCNDINKETFKIYDAVKLYEALADSTSMKPVVITPNISFKQLIEEITQVSGEQEKQFIRDQFLSKLQRKKQHMNDQTSQDFETTTGMTANEFSKKLKSMPIEKVAEWFTQNPDLGEILDRKGEGQAIQIIVSDHKDKLESVERGYGKATRPEDYLQNFNKYIQENKDTLPALITVLTRPRDLTRKQLRELTLALDKAGFTETNLKIAYREMTNQDMAARIVGYIRKAAMDEDLRPYDQRVDNALQTLMASNTWSTPQRDWLNRIAAQTKANLVVDKDALNDVNLIFKQEGGGFDRLDRIFKGQLEDVLTDFNARIWQSN